MPKHAVFAQNVVSSFEPDPLSLYLSLDEPLRSPYMTPGTPPTVNVVRVGVEMSKVLPLKPLTSCLTVLILFFSA